MRRGGKTDATHAAVRDGLRALGWSVIDGSALGGGWPDLLVSIGPALPFAPAKKARGLLTAGECFFVEVKGAGGTLTAAQQEWAWQFRGPLIVAESAEDVIDCIAQLRAARKGR